MIPSLRRFRRVAEDLVAAAAEVPDWEDVWHVARIETAPDGVRSSTEPGSRGAHADPVGEAVVARDQAPPDVVTAWCEEWWASMVEALGLLRRAGRLAWLVRHRADARALDGAGVGHCRACERWVPGSAVDRLRAGLCEACYAAWRRWGATATDPGDLGAFLASRRSEG